ncbi:hypothetical protein H2248_005017 [Termitomyces sp. 'cryptogamus']|nr:hypothetical protein H2248_005017 [Termitomyces sp. 'cryptogamus']
MSVLDGIETGRSSIARLTLTDVNVFNLLRHSNRLGDLFAAPFMTSDLKGYTVKLCFAANRSRETPL